MSNNEQIQAMVAPFIGVVSTEKIDAGVRFLSAINAVYTSAEPVIHTIGDEFVSRINKLPEKEKEQFFKEFKGEEDMVIIHKKTFAEQCSELHDCLPVNPTKDALTELHNQMIDHITELEALCLNALYHHQGSSSAVGQPIRKALGMGQFDRITEDQLKTIHNVRALQSAIAEGKA